MKTIGYWSTIMDYARRAGRARRAGDETKARELDQAAQEYAKQCDEISLDCPAPAKEQS